MGDAELLLPVLGPCEAARKPKENMEGGGGSPQKKNHRDLFSKVESGRIRQKPLWSE